MKHTNWVHLTATLSATVYLLSSSSSRAQELLSQGMESGVEQQVFNNACRTCHSIREGDNRLGPNLFKIIGRRAGALPGYNYSSAMKNADFVWDEAKLTRFIANPDEIVPGNKMLPYGGLASAEDRERVVNFLLRMKPDRTLVFAICMHQKKPARRREAKGVAAVCEFQSTVHNACPVLLCKPALLCRPLLPCEPVLVRPTVSRLGSADAPAIFNVLACGVRTAI